MNETQAVFTLFFAISWGTVANVLSKWKPFHFAMFFEKGFPQPTRRVLLAFLVFNILPWGAFGLVLYWLRGPSINAEDWTGVSALRLVVRAILPGIVPHGFYRIWLAIIQWLPSCFYGAKQDLIPSAFQVSKDRKETYKGLHEPTQEYLDLKSPGAFRNLLFGVVYVAFIFWSLLPG